MQNGIDPQYVIEKTAEQTLTNIGRALTLGEELEMNDDLLAERYLFNERRKALMSLLEWQVGYEVAKEELKEFTNNDKGGNDAKMESLTTQVNRALQYKKMWELRLKAVLKATEEGFGSKIIAENYGNISPAQGTKSKAPAEKVSKKSKSEPESSTDAA